MSTSKIVDIKDDPNSVSLCFISFIFRFPLCFSCNWCAKGHMQNNMCCSSNSDDISGTSHELLDNEMALLFVSLSALFFSLFLVWAREWSAECLWILHTNESLKSFSYVCARVCIYLYAKREMNGSFTHSHTNILSFVRSSKFLSYCFFFVCMHLCLASDKDFPAASSQAKGSSKDVAINSPNKLQRTRCTRQMCVSAYMQKMRANQFGAHIPCFCRVAATIVAANRSKVQVFLLCTAVACSLSIWIWICTFSPFKMRNTFRSHMHTQQSKLARYSKLIRLKEHQCLHKI